MKIYPTNRRVLIEPQDYGSGIKIGSNPASMGKVVAVNDREMWTGVDIPVILGQTVYYKRDAGIGIQYDDKILMLVEKDDILAITNNDGGGY